MLYGYTNGIYVLDHAQESLPVSNLKIIYILYNVFIGIYNFFNFFFS